MPLLREDDDPAVLFRETQKFGQWWLWVIFLAVEALCIYSITVQLILHRPQGNHPASAGGLIFLFLFITLFMYLFYITRLDTKIDTQGVAYRWRPFQKKYRKILWKDIENAAIIKYFFVGYGWHWSIRFGEVHNTGGNRGLLLTFINKRKMLLGTRRPDEVIAALGQLQKTFPGG